MKNVLRHVVTSAALVAGLAVTGAARADVGVSFSGTFPLPHGQISIGVGDPYFHVGAVVPVGYQVYARSGYGYGFAYNNHWVPVRPNGGVWLVSARPYFNDVYYDTVYYDPYYGAGYGGYYGGYYVHPSHRYAQRAAYHRSYANHNYSPYHRRYERNGHRNDDRSDRSHRGNRHGDEHRH